MAVAGGWRQPTAPAPQPVAANGFDLPTTTRWPWRRATPRSSPRTLWVSAAPPPLFAATVRCWPLRAAGGNQRRPLRNQSPPTASTCRRPRGGRGAAPGLLAAKIVQFARISCLNFAPEGRARRSKSKKTENQNLGISYQVSLQNCNFYGPVHLRKFLAKFLVKSKNQIFSLRGCLFLNFRCRGPLGARNTKSA